MGQTITAGELAAALRLPIRGNHAARLSGAAVLDAAGPDQLAFVNGPRYFAAGIASRAACLIAPPEFSGDQTIIESSRPRAHFAQALTMLYPPRQLPPGIHPSAVVDTSATIGEGTHIGAGCSVGAGSVIGANCVLYPRVTIYPDVKIGARCVIHSGAVVGADGFGFERVDGRYEKVPQVGTVEIGNDVEIGANTCIDRAALGTTIIGDGTKLDNLVHIAHNCRIGKHVVIAAQTGLAGGVEIGDDAIIGGQVGMGDKVRVEPGAVVGSGAGILTSKIVRAGEPVWGTPARPLRQYLAQLATLSRLAAKRR